MTCDSASGSDLSRPFLYFYGLLETFSCFSWQHYATKMWDEGLLPLKIQFHFIADFVPREGVKRCANQVAKVKEDAQRCGFKVHDESIVEHHGKACFKIRA